ncbi:MAG: hypothetical protein ACXVP5_03855 [Tumebacillaceae bacterium]
MSICSRLGWVLMSTLVVGTLVTSSGCTARSQAENTKNARVQELPVQGLLPLRSTDMKAFENALFLSLNPPADTKAQFRVLTTHDVGNGTYVLYQLPHNDGLAFAGRDAMGNVTIRKAQWPFAVTDPNKDLVVVQAVPPNNNVNPTYGVLAGRVYNPFIEYIEINYRDGHKEHLDVTHTRGFITVRKAFDPRFVEVRGYGMNGNGYWSIDTR